MDKEKYTISVTKASELLNCSKQTIYRKVREDKLRAIKKDSPYGEMIFIHQEDINQAVITKEVIDVQEVNQSLPLESLLGGLKEVFQLAIEEHTQELMKDNRKLVNGLVKQNLNLSQQISQLNRENEEIKRQNKEIMKALVQLKRERKV